VGLLCGTPGRRTLKSSGDEASETFARLYDEEFRVVAHAALTIVGSSSSAQEVAQEAFAVAWSRWSHVRDLDRPGAWVRRVAINLALKERTKAARSRPQAELPEQPVSTQHHDDREVMARAIATLPDNQRIALVLRYVHDLSIADVAESLGCKEPTARVHLHRARNKLAELLPPMMGER